MANLNLTDYQALFEQSPGAYLLLAPDTPRFTIVDVNNAYLNVTMTKKADILGKSLFEVFPDNPSEKEATGVRNLRESLNKVIEKKAPHTMALQKYDIRQPDTGTFEERWWSPVNTPVLDSSGKLAYIIHHVVNVTEFVKAEIRTKSEDTTQLTVQPQIRRKSPLLNAVQFYPKLLVTGFILAIFILITVGSLAYRNLRAIATNDKWEKQTNAIILNLQKLLNFTVDAETGERGFVITGEPVFLQPYNQALNKIEVAFDTLDQLSNMDAVQLERLDSLVKLKLAELDTINQLRQTGGFSAAQDRVATARGKILQDRIRKEVTSLQDEQIQLLQQRSRVKLRNMTSAVYMLIAGALFALSLLVLIFFLLRNEISKRLRSEDALKKKAMELERSNKDLEQFTYFVSHDLQEPLRAITGFLSFLKKDYGDKLNEDALEDIDEAVAGSERMKNMIQDLLLVSRISTRGEPFKPVDMNAVVNDAIDNLHSSAKESGAVFRKEKLPMVIADHTQLVLLFQNLIGNAVKYRGSKQPEIRIWAKREFNQWVFAVSDNGIGIDTQYFDIIFQVFQRLFTKDEYSGTGIGLAVCKRIVERHSGRIWVESTPGEGSTFYFTIPDKREYDEYRSEQPNSDSSGGR